MSRNQLNHSKLYKLAEYLKRAQRDLTDKQLAVEEIAEVASKALGFEVTFRNVAATAKIAGVELPRARLGRPLGGQAIFNQAFADRLDRQETAISALVSEVAKLAQEVKRLKTALGE